MDTEGSGGLPLSARSSEQDALWGSVSRLSDLIRFGGSVAAPVPGLQWDVGDTLAHLIVQLEHFRGFLVGSRCAEDDLSGIVPGPVPDMVARVNERLLATVTDRRPDELCARLDHAAASYLDAVRGMEPSTPFSSWEGRSDARGATRTLVAESIVHGLDIARAWGRPWRTDAGHAAVALESVWTLLPRYVDPVATAGVRADFAVAPRGASPVHVQVADGAAVVSADVRRSSCRIHGRPDDLLFLAFGRVSVGYLLRRGRLFATGRRPWVGLRVPTWFLAP